MNRHTCRFKVKESQIFRFLKILQENNIIVGVVKNTPPLTNRVKVFNKDFWYRIVKKSFHESLFTGHILRSSLLDHIKNVDIQECSAYKINCF